MKKHELKSIGRNILAGLMVFAFVLSIPTSVNAHVVRKASWTMQLPAAAAELSSDLLTEEGQNIRINNVSNSYEIEIPVLNQQNENWHMTAVSLSPGHMRATLSSPDADWTEESPSIYYYYEEEETVEVEADEELAEEKDDGTQIVYLHLTVLGQDSVSGGANKTTEDTDQPAGETEQTGGTTETVLEESEAATLSFYQAEEGSAAEEGSSTEAGDGSGTEEGSETEGETPSDGDTSIEGGSSSGAAGSSTPATVYVRVTLTYGMEMTDYGEFEEGTGKTLSATFYVPLKESDSEAMTGTLKSCPSQYNPEAAIPLVTGEKGCELKLNQAENKEFPAMTRYTIGDGRTWVLYDGGTIRIPAKTAFAVDLSLTELNPSHTSNQTAEGKEGDGMTLLESVEVAGTEKTKLEIKAGSNTHNLEYVDVPTTSDTWMPFVLTDDYVVLKIPYQWGNAKPNAAIEQLKVQEGKLEWVAADSLFKIEPTVESNAIKVSKIDSAAAGTYQIKLSWLENGMTLYSLETVFYLQCGNKG